MNFSTFGNLFQAGGVWIILLAFATGRPQDIIESIGVGAVQIAAQAASIASNGGALIDDRGIDVPFGKAHSKSAVGVGEAILQRHHSDSSEEDRRRRRKRSTESTYFNLIPTETLNEIESLFPIPYYHDRVKRAACHGGGTGGTGGGTGGGTIDDGDDVDIIEARKKAALKRKAAQKRKANSSKKTSRKTKNPIVSEDDLDQSLRRRKRQTEVDDLNANMSKAGKDISEQAQQIAEKIRMAWENFANTIKEMVQQAKQTFSGANQGSQTAQEI